jgi:hypothetical protein
LAMPGEVFEVGKGSHETHPSFQVCWCVACMTRGNQSAVDSCGVMKRGWWTV